jgi:hypothetical protein
MSLSGWLGIAGRLAGLPVTALSYCCGASYRCICCACRIAAAGVVSNCDFDSAVLRALAGIEKKRSVLQVGGGASASADWGVLLLVYAYGCPASGCLLPASPSALPQPA